MYFDHSCAWMSMAHAETGDIASSRKRSRHRGLNQMPRNDFDRCSRQRQTLIYVSDIQACCTDA